MGATVRGFVGFQPRRYALCAPRFALLSAAGPDTDPADMVAETECFGEDSQLLVAAKVIEVFGSLGNGSDRT